MRADYHGYRLPVGYRLLGVIALRARTRWRLYGKRGNEVVTGNHASGTRRNSTSRGYAHDRHVGPRSNISREAEQPSEHAPAGHQSRNVKQGKMGKMSNCDVNGSFPGSYAEDRDGNSRASSFCLLRRRTWRQVPQK